MRIDDFAEGANATAEAMGRLGFPWDYLHQTCTAEARKRLTPKQGRCVDAQSERQALDVVDRDVRLASLDRAYEGAVKFGLGAEVLLAPAAFLAHAPEVNGEDLPQGWFARPHGRKSTSEMRLRRQHIPSILTRGRSRPRCCCPALGPEHEH